MPPELRRGPVRARDLRTNIAELGFEKGVVATLELILDEFAGDRQHLREMTELLDHCIDLITKLQVVGDQMTKRMDQIKRDQAGEADLDNR